MGLDLTYDAGNGSVFTRRFSHADWMTIYALRAHLPNEVAVCFDTAEPGEPDRVGTVALRESATVLDRFLADNADLLPATYQFKLERFPVPGVRAGGFDTGGISGLRLPGDQDHFYTIRAGLNECKLTKARVGPDGQGVIVEERDLRGEAELLTECAGRVQFRRRAAKSTLRRALGEIAAFAGSAGTVELTKTVG